MINTLIISSNNQLVDYLEDIINSSIKTKITTCNNGYESLTYIQENKPDLMIVDIDLNDINGIELFQELQKKNITCHKILYSNKHEDYIEVAAYDSGVDDFVTDKIKKHVLQKKIIQIYSRLQKNKQLTYYNSLIIDRAKFIISDKNDDYFLPKKQFLMYALLCENPGNVFSREKIYRSVWGEEMPFNNRTVDVHIRQIRKILPNNNLTTYRGIGYKVASIK